MLISAWIVILATGLGLWRLVRLTEQDLADSNEDFIFY